MPPTRKQSTLDVVVNIFEGVHSEELAAKQPARAQQQETSKWLSSRIILFKRRIAESGGMPPPAANTSSVIFSPAYKKIKSTPKPTLPEELTASVRAMKVKQLQTALRSRNLNTKGLKSELRERLLAALYDEHFSKKPSQKSNSPHRPEAQSFQRNEGGVEEMRSPPPRPARNDVLEEMQQSPEPMQENNVAESHRISIDELVEHTDSMHISDEDHDNQMADADVRCNVGEQEVTMAMEVEPEPCSKDEKMQQVVTLSDDPMSEKAPVPQSVKEIAQNMENTLSTFEKLNNKHEKPVVKGPSQTPSASETTSSKTASTTKSGAPSLTSQSVKAKNEAKMAKIQEMRQKSKPLVSLKAFEAPKQFLTSMSSLKNSAASALKKSTSEKSRLAKEMRAKSLKKKNGTTVINNENGNRTPQPKSPLMKVRTPLSPLDTYEITDNEEEDNSESESENEDAPQKSKYVPYWASRTNLVGQIDKQFKKSKVDPDRLFGEVETCDLEAIFPFAPEIAKVERYRPRTSSGDWTMDRVTKEEKDYYARAIREMRAGN